MARKIVGTWVLLVAIAASAVAPSMASAANDPDLTHPTGTLLAKGSAFKGTNVGTMTIKTPMGAALYQCTQINLTGTLKTNNGSEVEADVESFSFSGTGSFGECTNSLRPTHWEPSPPVNGLPWCLRSTSTMKDDEVQIRGGSCAGLSRPIRIVQQTTFATETGVDAIECIYERAEPVTATYETHPGDAIVKISEVEWKKVAGGSFLCGAGYRFEMSFTLETDEASASPLYIS